MLLPPPRLPVSLPPAASTFPSGNSTILKFSRAVARESVEVQVPIVRLYTSADVNTALALSPPAARTFPFSKSTIENSERAVVRESVAVQVPIAGLYTSVEAMGVKPLLSL